MKSKSLLMVAFSMLVGTAAKAQAFEQGNTIVSVGYGFGNLSKSIFKLYQDEAGYKYRGLGPIYAGAEYIISDKIGLGLSVNYVSAKVSWTDTDSTGGGTYDYSINWSSLSALLRVNMHFGESDMFDPYLGFGLGYRMGQTSYKTTDPFWDSEKISNPFPLGFEAVFGVRFYPVEMFNIFTEVGLAKAPIKFGVGIKI